MAVLLAFLLSGCATAPSASPSTRQPSDLWVQATVELPSIVTAQASGAPLGQQCSPCHQSVVDLLLGVATTPSGFIAVGIQEPPAVAVAWRSVDAGRTWTPLPGLRAVDGSEADAAVAAHGRIVVVGGGPDGALSWASTDGGDAWTTAPASPDLAGPHGTARMTSVIAWGDGFVAAGLRDSLETGRSAAEVWSSPDGLTWQLVAGGTDPDAGDTGGADMGGAIYGLAATSDTIVAVGTTGDQFRGPAGVWRSHDTEHWSNVTSADLAQGAMAAVTAGGPGFVAVGSGHGDTGAAAWVSADGESWRSAPDTSAFQHHGLPIRMAAVIPVGAGLAAVGWMSSAANGTGTIWRSADGLTWTRDPDQTSLLGGELTDVALAPDTLVGVGLGGYPDNDQAQVWLGPR
ncbi:MAG TPA: sialidase family protein [Candidatus Limnocylindrales bacterium]|nr:sialidase family protein [Candidatus Limnocylindrales bacterium]